MIRDTNTFNVFYASTVKGLCLQIFNIVPYVVQNCHAVFLMRFCYISWLFDKKFNLLLEIKKKNKLKLK